MFKIKITTKDETGYYCGVFHHEGQMLCGYENDPSKSNVKNYKTEKGAAKALNHLLDIYGDGYYQFEIINA